MIGGIFGMIKGVVKWVKELFGFGEKEKADAVGETSIFGIMKDALSGVWEWFKNLFDIDFSSILSNLIPAPIKAGLEKIGLGGIFGGGKKELTLREKSMAALDRSIGKAMGEIKSYEAMKKGGTFGPGDVTELDNLRKKVAELQRTQAVVAAGGGVNVNAPTNISNETSTSTSLMKTQPGPMVLAVAGMGME